MSIDNLRAIFFRGKQKEENLVIAGIRHTLPTGTVVKYLLETSEEFFEELSKIADELLTISVKEQNLESKDATDIFEAVKVTKTVMELSAPMLLKELMLLLPAHAGYAEALRKEDQVHFSKLELAEFEHKLLRDGRTQQERVADTEAFYERRRSIGEHPAQTSRWRRWLSYLVEDITFEELSFDLNAWKDREKVLEIIRQYGSNLRSIGIEANKLRRSIAIAVGIEPSQYLSRTEAVDDLICCIEPAELLRTEVERTLFPNCSDKEKVQGYAATSLATLVSLEMQLYVQYRLEFKKCAFCGGHFATRGSKSKYCKYPNEAYDGKTCQKIAAQQVFWKSNPLMGEYQKSYSKYRRWINRTTAKDEGKILDRMAELRDEMYRRYGKRRGARALKIIDREIESVFSAWDVNARSMLEKFKDGMISEEDCRAALVVPSVPERSPILASWDGVNLDINEDDLEIK